MKKTYGRIKSGFYKGYIDEVALRLKAEKDAKKSDKPISHILKALFETAVSLLRFIGYIVLFFLSSVGLTALINSDIRIMLIEIFRDTF